MHNYIYYGFHYILVNLMMNQTEEKEKSDLVDYTTEEIHQFFDNTHMAISMMLQVVQKIKKDHYESENDELDELLEEVEHNLSEMESVL